MEGDPDKFDGILMTIAQQSGSIDAILDSFFGFLQRKTDFFSGAQSDEAARELVLKYYSKHWKVGQKKRAEIQEKNRIADEERKAKAEEKRRKDEEEYKKRQEEMASRPKVEEVTEEEAEAIKAKKEAKEKPEGEDDGNKSDEDKEPPPTGNGGATDKYTWTQTLGALEVFVPVRPGLKAKQLVCDIGIDTLKVGVKGEPPILDGKLHAKVKPDDCMWTLIDNKVIQINFEKFDNMKWWSCVMQGDAEINTKKIVPENSKLSDLDGETRMTVEKMMYDQRQKALGKPSSDQEKQHDLLEKFKAAHPEMDFSKAKINYGGGGGDGFNFS
mmetsp:Transcript_35313/g.75247  ORF Transcript_35313/g.75247 Transcript_35313/m.75247 type:complete len:328 (-) Transcript_35313:104-1087(-)|eukprot:CAMPEP_0206472810 /NCGR_PEP_ID=MMETSP0324_2-20121206/32451_1 /ASSEMBLY_ACC=CAM_ASM_000836 /TAXON_ID=2866 /ORGANISM="Crypthecodinium cohnii, Strain Seligo" /LENGTH=327 /DNA_ID=CAMNT_0053947539 /DNA_START=93 /DNA_END=1076 /DNA_ORIENTATION=+